MLAGFVRRVSELHDLRNSKINVSLFFVGSNHYGIAGWYSLRAMKEGLVGLSMTNTSPLMSPTRSTGVS